MATANIGTDTSIDRTDSGAIDRPNGNGERIGGYPVEPISGGETKRGRGRPRKDGGSPGGNTGGPGRTDSGNTAGSKKETKSLSVGTLASILSTLHEFAALGMGSDKIRLDDDECEKLAKALVELQKYYPSIDLPGVVLAWVNLVSAGIQVYGPRVGSALLDARRKPAAGPAKVINLAGNHNG